MTPVFYRHREPVQTITLPLLQVARAGTITTINKEDATLWQHFVEESSRHRAGLSSWMKERCRATQK